LVGGFLFEAWNNQVQCQGSWHLQAPQNTQYKSQIMYNKNKKILLKIKTYWY